MLTVREKRIGNEVYYIVGNDDKKEVLLTETIHYRTANVETDGKIYLVLYDSQMELQRDVFDFLNYGLERRSINSRDKALRALKMLFSYQTIIRKELKDFSKSDLDDFVRFLRGYSYKGQNITYEELTERSAETVNGYLSVYRAFLDYIGKNNDILKRQKAKHGWYGRNDNKGKYEINERVSAESQNVPMYITPEEFAAIIKIIRKEYSDREECIVRLMYETGLRIGEVLGLTNEDIVIEKDECGIESPVCYIRNRVSDKAYQKAKTCMTVTSRNDYAKREYSLLGVGFQIVTLPEDLYKSLNDYIEESRSSVLEKYGESRLWESKADSVTSRSLTDGEKVKNEKEQIDNFYVFITDHGKILSNVMWNKKLREIMKKAGLRLDSNRRGHNLNHRFRHGFAMFHVKYMDIKEMELMTLMRHKSLASTSCYVRPTLSDRFKLQEEFSNNLHELFPEINSSSMR